MTEMLTIVILLACLLDILTKKITKMALLTRSLKKLQNSKQVGLYTLSS